jgi:VanZ family protein
MPFSIWDKGAHFIAYGVLSFFVYGALALRTSRWKTALLLTVGLSAVLGGLDEVHQMFVPGRTPALDDLTADIIGGVGGGILGLSVLRALLHRQVESAEAS